MPNTTNFNWATPADTDLVKDGAAAIRTLGNSIDTSLVDLKGGTTGQILSKNSNTDLDYTWVTPNVGDITEVQAGTGISVASGTGPIPVVTNSMATEITAKGDLIVGTGSGTFDNLPVGTNGHILVADSSVSPTGVKWAAPAASGANWTLLNAGGTSLTGAATVTVSGISNADKIMVLFKDASSGTAQSQIYLRLNTDTNNNYYAFGQWQVAGSTYSANNYENVGGVASGQFTVARMANNAASVCDGAILISGCNSSGAKIMNLVGGATPGGSSGQIHVVSGGYYDSSSAISSISIVAQSGSLDNGTVYVFTSA